MAQQFLGMAQQFQTIRDEMAQQNRAIIAILAQIANRPVN